MGRESSRALEHPEELKDAIPRLSPSGTPKWPRRYSPLAGKLSPRDVARPRQEPDTQQLIPAAAGFDDLSQLLDHAFGDLWVLAHDVVLFSRISIEIEQAKLFHRGVGEEFFNHHVPGAL